MNQKEINLAINSYLAEMCSIIKEQQQRIETLEEQVHQINQDIAIIKGI